MCDNVDHRYGHTDADQVAGLLAVNNLLHLGQPPARVGLLYDLNFFSGGILNRLAITLPADPIIWSHVTAALSGKTPEQAAAISDWIADFTWLLTGEEGAVALRPAAVQFINKERLDFQSSFRLKAMSTIGRSCGEMMRS